MEKDQLRQTRFHGTHSLPLASYMHDIQSEGYVEMHWHEDTEIVYLDNGLYIVNVNFEQVEIKGPAFVFINPGEVHQYSFPSGQGERAIVFDMNMLTFEMFDAVQHAVFAPLMDGRLKLPRFIFEDDKVYAQIKEFYDKIYSLSKETTISAYLTIKAHFYQILSCLYEENLLIRVADNEKIEHIKSILTYLRLNSSQKITINMAASFAGMNPQYFCRYFKKYTGKTMTEYINEVRIEKAAELLVSTDDLISDIAQQCGFDNLGYFIKRFTEKKKMSPSHFRKSQNSVINGQDK